MGFISFLSIFCGINFGFSFFFSSTSGLIFVSSGILTDSCSGSIGKSSSFFTSSSIDGFFFLVFFFFSGISFTTSSSGFSSGNLPSKVKSLSFSSSSGFSFLNGFSFISSGSSIGLSAWGILNFTSSGGGDSFFFPFPKINFFSGVGSSGF
uniref:Uncharacterized protein n=1 Tax=Panstrongylus lignarius TaxID=156445 RepID=A0A224XN24_9HEMI